MAHYAGFGILIGFEFEQIVVAFGPIVRSAAMQHQPLPALSDNARQHGLQLGEVVYLELCHMLHPRLSDCRDDSSQFDITFIEFARMPG